MKDIPLDIQKTYKVKLIYRQTGEDKSLDLNKESKCFSVKYLIINIIQIERPLEDS